MALTDSLIAYWKLDEASGTRNDSHGVNHLTDNNTVLSATGKIAGGADFERANSETLSIADNSELSLGANTDFTITAWIKHEDYTQGVFGIVQKHGDDATASQSSAEYSFYSAFGTPRFIVGNGTTSIEHDSAQQLSDGGFHFIIAWYSSSAQKVFIQIDNGTPTESAWTGGTQNTTSSFYIGGYEAGTTFMDGIIDEVGFWKRVLTAQERTDLYNSGAGLAYSTFNPAGPAGVILPVRTVIIVPFSR